MIQDSNKKYYLARIRAYLSVLAALRKNRFPVACPADRIPDHDLGLGMERSA